RSLTERAEIGHLPVELFPVLRGVHGPAELVVAALEGVGERLLGGGHHIGAGDPGAVEPVRGLDGLLRAHFAQRALVLPGVALPLVPAQRSDRMSAPAMS